MVFRSSFSDFSSLLGRLFLEPKGISLCRERFSSPGLLHVWLATRHATSQPASQSAHPFARRPARPPVSQSASQSTRVYSIRSGLASGSPRETNSVERDSIWQYETGVLTSCERMMGRKHSASVVSKFSSWSEADETHCSRHEFFSRCKHKYERPTARRGAARSKAEGRRPVGRSAGWPAGRQAGRQASSC